MATVLVTGGAGFIGTHLCRRLTSAQHEVRVLDLLDPKTPVSGVKYFRGDVRSRETLAEMVNGVDAVYHFAAIVSVPVCQQQPVESHQTNLMATLFVLDAVVAESKRRSKPVKMIFAGSSVVYGGIAKEGERCIETMPMAWPLSYYGAQKLGSEHAIRLYHEHHGVPAVVYRFFNVYGPGQDPKSPYSGVISIFSSRIQEGRDLQLHGAGAQTRDFISVHDVSRACAMAMDLSVDKCDGNAMNLGFGTSVTIRQLAQEMVSASGKIVPFIDAPTREGDIKYSLSSIERAERVLGWKPQVTLREGLKELLSSKA